ncbi:MAG: glycosyltransferase [Candidatus Sulfotelmatobacter sp.]|jgi:glycosyltransferase involved in cell wall biosynthesis
MPAKLDVALKNPVISIIVPARNEEASLETCLNSLIEQTGVAFEVIVVDDHSIDHTRAIAASFANSAGNSKVRVIEAAPLPPGWTGKNNAVTSGVRVARGEWFLFTDADTVHLPGSLGRALNEAQFYKASMLSYSPEQIVKGFWEKAVMPVIFAELAITFRPSLVSDPNSPAAAANGQYILITREAYESVGGHSAIAARLLEDVALARRVKQSGRPIFFRFAPDAVRTRMYRSFAQLREGWTKNLALLFSSPGRLAALRLTEFVLIFASLVIAMVALLRGELRSAAIVAMLATILYGRFVARIRRAHFSWDATLLAIFGLPLFSYLLLRSKIVHGQKCIPWKGRTYSEVTSLLATGR